MESYSAYRVKICGYSHIFRQTTELYREAVKFFITVADRERDSLCRLDPMRRNNRINKASGIGVRKRDSNGFNKLVALKKNGQRIAWLTNKKAAWRFMTSRWNKRDFFV